MPASSGKIGADQIIDPSMWPTLFDNVNKLIELLDKSQDKIKENLIAMRSILSQKLTNTETIAELQKANAKIREQDEALKKLRTTSKLLTLEQAKQKIQASEYNKVVKEQAKIALDLTTEYQRQSKTLIDLRKQAQSVLLANQENTVSGKALIAQYTELDQKLKRVDDTLGQHQRHVGNYTHSVINAFKATGGFSGALDILGKVMGVDEETLRGFTEAHHLLASAARDLHHITQLETESTEAHTIQQEIHDAAIEEGTVATEGLTAAKEMDTAATEEATVATGELNEVMMLNPAVLVAAAVAALAIGLGMLLSSTKDNLEINKAFNKAMDSTLQTLEDQRDELEKLSIEYDVLSGKISKFEGQRLNSSLEINQKIAESDKRFLEQKAEMQKAFEESQGGVVNAILGVTETQTATSARAAAQYYSELHSLEIAHDAETLNYRTEEAKKRMNITQEEANETKKEKDKDLKDLLKLEEEYWKKLRDLQTENIEYTYDRKKQMIFDNWSDESKKYAGQTEILKQLDIKRDHELKELYREQQAEWDKIRQETKNEDIKRVQDDAKKESDLNKDPAFSPQLKANFELADKEKDLRKKKHDKEVEDSFNLAESLEKIEKDHIEKMNAMKIAAIDHDLQRNQSAIDVQLALAAAGKANTLQYELNKQDELEKARVREQQAQKKRAKEEEAVELALAFTKAYEKNLETMKPAQALAGATTETLTAKLLGKAIAGSALEGTENTGKAKGRGIDGKGGMLWMIHEEEGVATAKGNKKYKGAVGAINEGNLEDWAMKNIMLPNYQSSTMLSDVSRSSQVNSAINEMMVNEIREMKEILRDKPENYSNIDNLGNVAKHFVKRAFSHTIYKKTFID